MKVLAFLCALVCWQLQAQERFWFASQKFMPDNDLGRFDSEDQVANISQEEFEEVLAGVEAFYRPLVSELYGAKLVVVRDWSDSTVNAYATRSGATWEVHMFGGLARRREITPDGFAMVACHEVGHHLGGFPYVQSWAANDGQADYFSSLSCARQLWKGEHEKNELAAEKIPSFPKAQCDKAWDEKDARALCYRTVLAGKSLADLLSSGSAKYDKPDKGEVSKTNNAHPAGQCRLDTYVAGALCKVEFDERKVPKSEKDSAAVSCLQSRKELGYRPRCWFKPIL